MFDRLRLRVRAFLERGRLDRDLDEEIRHHLALREESYRRDGMTPEEAREAASRRFGSAVAWKEACRDLWAFVSLESLAQDLRSGARLLRRSPGFTAVAVLSLTLGIGANTALFQLIDALRLRSLPLARPAELAEIQIADMGKAKGSFSSWNGTITYPAWKEISARSGTAFSGVAALGERNFNLATGGEVREARGLLVSGGLFDVLGVTPIAGRVLHESDDRRGCGSPGAVLSYGFWQRQFGGDPSVPGRVLTVDGHPIEVVGVAARSFFGVEVGRSFDIALPICAEDSLRGEDSYLDRRDAWWLTVIGRLRPGVSAAQANARVGAMSPAILRATIPPKFPPSDVQDYLSLKFAVRPARTGISELRSTYSAPLGYLLAIAATVLLIACANLANLLLARVAVRGREIAVRLAIGASRPRLVRQLLVESLLLAAMGAALGCALAGLLSRALLSFLNSRSDPISVELHTDLRVLAFTTGLAIATCVLCGLVPALKGTREAPAAAMKAGGRGSTGDRQGLGLRRALVVAQVSMSLVLLVCALLFVQSLRKLVTLDAGFRRTGIVATYAGLRNLAVPPASRVRFKRSLLERIRAVQGVDSAAEARIVPLSGSAWNERVRIAGRATNLREVFFNRVSGGYFATVGTTQLAGRDFDGRDRETTPQVAIVNQTFARKIAGVSNPIGLTIEVPPELDEAPVSYEIVGVVRDSKYQRLRDDFQPQIFLAAGQDPQPGQMDRLLVRSRAPLAGLTSSLLGTLREVDPRISVEFEPFEGQIDEGLARDRLMATLSSGFGFLAAILASVGLFGMMSYSVAGRRTEIGIRMAIGARPGDVRWLVLRETLLLVAAGVAIGLPVVIVAARSISSLLFGMAPTDPVSLVVAALAMACVGLIAGYVPARRASGVDPMQALRSD